MSGSFTLDTRGEVPLDLPNYGPHQIVGGYEWSDLSPFEQGFAEGLLKQAWANFQVPSGDAVTVVRFSDLSPEALALILRDCRDVMASNPGMHTRIDGEQFFVARQAGSWPTFPPLAITLADDGKVHLAVAS